MSRFLPLAVCAALVGGCGSDEPPQSKAPTRAAAEKALAGAPAPLAALHDQGSELLEGGTAAFEQRLDQLEGYPVVVNKWASWCGPCRAEFPSFQSQALKRGEEVAFLGINSNDNAASARQFLEQYPVTYPSYVDPDLKIAAAVKAVASFPATVFYDRKGEIEHVKQGGYPTEEALAKDIERYAR